MAITTAASVDEIMRELESLGTEQNRRVFARHGVTGDHFGVSYANLYAIQKRIKVDDALADGLWATGNHDARILATLIADPKALTLEKLGRWTNESQSHVMSTSLAIFGAKSPNARAFGEAWKDDDSEWRGQIAWSLLTSATSDESIPDVYWEGLIEQIEREIHQRKNRVRYSMLNTLIGIGSINENLRARALAAAGRIGKVEVDHFGTSCKTPNPLTEIDKTYNHRHRKKK